MFAIIHVVGQQLVKLNGVLQKTREEFELRLKPGTIHRFEHFKFA